MRMTLVPLAAACVALAACSSGTPKAITAPSTTAAAPVTTSASPSASDAPTASPSSTAPDFSPASAEQFVTAYYAEANQAIMTMNSALGKERTSDTCNCRSLFTDIDTQKAKGLHFDTTGFMIQNVFWRGNNTVLANLSVGASDLRDAQENSVEHTDAIANAAELITLEQNATGWSITTIARAT